MVHRNNAGRLGREGGREGGTFYLNDQVEALQAFHKPAVNQLPACLAAMSSILSYSSGVTPWFLSPGLLL